MASKRVKCPGINSIKEVTHLYTENYKTLMEKMEDDANKCKHTYAQG